MYMPTYSQRGMYQTIIPALGLGIGRLMSSKPAVGSSRSNFVTMTAQFPFASSLLSAMSANGPVPMICVLCLLSLCVVAKTACNERRERDDRG